MHGIILKGFSVSVFLCGLWLLQSYADTLEFSRDKVLSGEIWRLWTGHFVHTTAMHFLFNALAVTVIAFGFLPKLSLPCIVLRGFILSTLISLTLLITYPELAWYNGLSGLLHALLAYFFVCLAREENPLFWFGFLILWIKVISETVQAGFGYEHFQGSMSVITEAHFWGVLYGTILAIIERVRYRQPRGDE